MLSDIPQTSATISEVTPPMLFKWNPKKFNKNEAQQPKPL